MGIQPWLMWGSTQTFSLEQSSPLGTAGQSQQIARIDYARPETWSFFFSAQVLNAVNLGGAGNTAGLSLSFDLNIGIGRSTVLIPGFEQYVISLDSTVNLNVGKLFYSTEVIAPPRTSSSTAENIIRDFCSQSINLVASAALSSSASEWHVDVAVSAFFAPRTHVRPEWFKDGTFTGGENFGL